MKFKPDQIRAIKLILLTLVVGAIAGTGLFQLIAFLIPEGVVQEFFLNSVTMGIQPFTFNLEVISFTIGFTIEVGVGSLIGMAVAWYFLRYFR